MLRCRHLPVALRAAALLAVFGLARPVAADVPEKSESQALPAALDKAVPESVADLKAIQKHVKTVLARVLPATVNVQIGPGQGSGVIISADGYVLTAGHVAGEPGRNVKIRLFVAGKFREVNG